MNTPQPTATPYRLDVDHNATPGFQLAIKGQEGEPTVALLVIPDYCIGNDNSRQFAKAKANAEFIVRACNAHAGLVTALEKLIRVMGIAEAARDPEAEARAFQEAETALAQTKATP